MLFLFAQEEGESPMVKNIFLIALYSVKQKIVEPRIICLFIFMTIFVFNDISVINNFCQMVGVRTSPFIFPFFSSDPVKQLIMLAGIIFLFSEAPFINSSQPYVIIRSRRLAWTIGQVLYIGAMSGIYYIVLFSASILSLLPNLTFATDGWGIVLNTLAQTDAAYQIQLQFGIMPEIIKYYSPFKASVLSLLLDWGVAWFLGLIIFVISLRVQQKIGIVVAGLVLFYDLLVTNMLPLSFYKFSPVSLSRLSILDPSNTSIYPSITYPYIFFVVGIISLCLLSIILSRKSSIEISTERS